MKNTKKILLTLSSMFMLTGCNTPGVKLSDEEYLQNAKNYLAREGLTYTEEDGIQLNEEDFAKDFAEKQHVIEKQYNSYELYTLDGEEKTTAYAYEEKYDYDGYYDCESKKEYWDVKSTYSSVYGEETYEGFDNYKYWWFYDAEEEDFLNYFVGEDEEGEYEEGYYDGGEYNDYYTNPNLFKLEGTFGSLKSVADYVFDMSANDVYPNETYTEYVRGEVNVVFDCKYKDEGNFTFKFSINILDWTHQTIDSGETYSCKSDGQITVEFVVNNYSCDKIEISYTNVNTYDDAGEISYDETISSLKSSWDNDYSTAAELPENYQENIYEI